MSVVGPGPIVLLVGALIVIAIVVIIVGLVISALSSKKREGDQ